MPTEDHPAGWYPDPAGQADLRFWDGERWTSHTAPAPAEAGEPAGAEGPQSSEPPAAEAVTAPLSVTAPQPPAAEAVTAPQPITTPRPVTPAPAADGQSSRRRLAAALLALAGLLAATIGIVLVVGDSGDGADPTPTVQATLEPADSLGPEPYTDDFAAAPVVPVPPALEAALPAPARTPASDTGAGTSTPRSDARDRGDVVRVRATEPGLYGGTQDDTECDTEQLVSFLDSEPAKSTAWVEALNADDTVVFRDTILEPEDIADYVDTLTPVVLLADTLVVNHGFADGRPTPRESVLQKGSAVLVDPLGVPRTRCACGNPLTAPPSTVTGVEATGAPWPGYDPGKVAVVEPLPATVTFLSLVDLGTGDTFERPVGSKGDRDVPTVAPTPAPDPTATPTPAPSATAAPTPAPAATPPVAPRPTAEPTAPPTAQPTPTVPLGTGDVQVTLRWTTDTDLDLHVIDPGGVEISFGNRTSPSGGQLDVDDVPQSGDTGPHVENIFWEVATAPPGDYQAWVVHYSGSPSAYSLEVRVDGTLVHSEEGTLSAGESSARVAFAR